MASHIASQTQSRAAAAIDWQATIKKYDVVARRFAPILTFDMDPAFHPRSEETRYPCSIDWLLPQTSLQGCHLSETPFHTNPGRGPSIVWFKDEFHMFYQGQGDGHNGRILRVKSRNSLRWYNDDPYFPITFECSDPPHAIVFLDKIFLFWRDRNGNGLMRSSSADGLTWTKQQYCGIDIDAQPHAAIQLSLVMWVVACDAGGNGIVVLCSADGIHFDRSWAHHDTNNGTPVSIVTHGKDVHLFFQEHNGQAIMHLPCTSPAFTLATESYPKCVNTGLYTSDGPAAVLVDDVIHLFFRDQHGNAVLHSIAEDGNGDNFSTPQSFGMFCDGQPQTFCINNTLCVGAASCNGGQAISLASIIVGMTGPKQSDLASHGEYTCLLEVQPSAYLGQPFGTTGIEAPMYYTVQEHPEAGYVDITYIMLYGSQGGQTVRYLRAGIMPFNCILDSYGAHEGDLEWAVVRLSTDLQKVKQVGFEAHGVVSFYNAGVNLGTMELEGEHPIIRVSRGGHACLNGSSKIGIDWFTTDGIDGSVATIDLMSKGGRQWRPFNLANGIQAMGLDSAGEPINDQVWAKYRGSIGRPYRNQLVSATTLNEQPLSGEMWDNVKTVDWESGMKAAVSTEAITGVGTKGPGCYDFITWKITT